MRKLLDETNPNFLMSQILRELVFNSNLTYAALAERSGVQQSTICNIISGKNNPRATTLKLLAKFFNISVGQLIGEEPLQNQKLQTPPPSRENWRQVPIINWADIESFAFRRSNLNFYGHSEWSMTEEPVTEGAFAVVTNQQYTPFIRANSVLIIDPGTKLKHGDLVVIGRLGQIPFIRKAIVEDTLHFKALHQDFPLINHDETIRVYGPIMEVKYTREQIIG